MAAIAGDDQKNPTKPDPTTTTTLHFHVGADEFSSPDLWRALATELVGTGILLFCLAAASIAVADSHGPDPKLILPLFIFPIAFLHLYVSIPISGGFLNPTFALVAALKGNVSLTRGVMSIVAECLGAVLGHLLLRACMDRALVDKHALAGCVLNDAVLGDGVSPWTGLVVEFTSNFLIMFVAVTVAFDPVRFKEIGLTMVTALIAGAYSLSIFVSVTVTGRSGYGGAGLSPARCLAAAAVYGGPLWDGLWVFWVGPILACFVYYGYTFTLPKTRRSESDG